MQGPSFVNQDIGLKERLLRVLYDPRTSFAAVYQRETTPDWFIPALLATVVGVAVYFVTLPIMLDPDSPELQMQLQAMSEEQRQHYLQSMRDFSWIGVPVGVFSTLVIVGGVLMVLARSLFKSEVTYQQMLIVKGYASLVLIPQWILRTFLVMINDTMVVYTGLGAFVPRDMRQTFEGRVLVAIDCFDFWQAWVLGIGLAAMAGVPTKRALIAVYVLWGLWILGGATVETISSALPVPEQAADGTSLEQ